MKVRGKKQDRSLEYWMADHRQQGPKRKRNFIYALHLLMITFEILPFEYKCIEDIKELKIFGLIS